MIVATDVQYDEEADCACAAAVAFDDWADAEPGRSWSLDVEGLAPYEPGRFYLRELPCLLALLDGIEADVVVVDGYVQLGDAPGLGAHLFAERGGIIVGVAKSAYRDAPAVKVLRGESERPLYVTAAGVDVETAARWVERMHGPYRVPTLLRLADQLARRGSPGPG